LLKDKQTDKQQRKYNLLVEVISHYKAVLPQIFIAEMAGGADPIKVWWDAKMGRLSSICTNV